MIGMLAYTFDRIDRCHDGEIQNFAVPRTYQNPPLKPIGETRRYLKPSPICPARISRSEESSVGKECVSRCKSRWSRDHEHKKIKNKTRRREKENDNIKE